MRKFNHTFLAVAFASLLLAGCGGGGGGSSDVKWQEMTDDTDGMDADTGGDTAMMCPEGQVGTYPDCAPAGPTAEAATETSQGRGHENCGPDRPGGRVGGCDP